MGTLKTTITDELFNQKRAHQYQLSILIGMDSFLYLVSDQSKHILLLKEYLFDQNKSSHHLPGERIHAFLQEDRLLKLNYGIVKIAFLGHKHTFVPNRLYHPDQKKIYLNHLADIEATEMVQSDDLTLLRSQNIFTVDRATLNFVQQIFPRAKSYHITSALYLGYRQCCEMGQGNVFLNIRDQRLQLFFFQERELLFSNTFQLKNTEDLTYYTLMLFQQFNLSGKTQVVNVAGDFSEGAAYHQALSRYVKYIQPVPLPIDFQFSEANSRQLQTHRFFDLMSILLCS